MSLIDDASAWLVQRSAPRTVTYGDALRFAGQELPEPSRVRVPTRRGFVTAEVYRPETGRVGPGSRGSAAYVHLHGGAFVMRHPRMDDFFCRIVAAEVGAVVLNVDFDVAPQVRYPVAHEQTHDVAAWLATHPRETGVDGRRVVVGGFSSGGNLAAAAALQARDLGSFVPAGQLLAVPAVDLASPVVRGSHSRISPRVQRMVRRTYFREADRRWEGCASPLLAPDLAGLPPAMVVTAERDALRPSGDAYAERLAGAGVPVVHRVVPGMDHYFLDGARPAHARAELTRLVAWLQARVG